MNDCMNDRIAQLSQAINAFHSTDLERIEEARIAWLGRKGQITALFEEFRKVPPEEKRAFGKPLNLLKQAAEERIRSLKEEAEASANANSGFSVDPTRPVRPFEDTARHPVSQVIERITEIFQRIGFTLSEGPEMEDDWHNFSALNFPEEHPARDMQDTFFLQSDPVMALRTHTSSVQVRSLEKKGVPIRILSPGRVFRNEAISARSHCIFHQVEGLYVDKGVSFADMKQTLLFFARELFGADARIRLRPSYFPFTEPSAEMDVWWGLESESDYRITKGTGWLEILGCGMVHPQVLRNCDIDPEEYSGYAFGIGIERIAMNLFGVNDLRLFYENDLRFLKQFV
jgi:phenylalanyl-tRNA synthetase alpha chain